MGKFVASAYTASRVSDKEVPIVDELRYRILLADDELSNMITLSRILSGEYDVIMAKGGEQAIALAIKAQPDLIVLDADMPELNGYDVMNKLKSDSRTAKIPILLTTDHARQSDEEKAFLAGAADHIPKPFKPVVVQSRVYTQMRILHQARINQELAMVDDLTGTANRRYFDERISMEWRRASRDKTMLSFLLLDLDDFREYNDVYGIAQGNALLKETANIITSFARRPADLAARLGADLFGLLLPETSFRNASRIAENLRKAIEHTDFRAPDGREARVTVSIGLVCTIPDTTLSMATYLHLADQQLNQAKCEEQLSICSIMLGEH